jgi:hypothetical protein
MTNDGEATSSLSQLPDVAGRNLRDLMDDPNPQLRAAIGELVKIVKNSPGVQLGWSSRIDLDDTVPAIPASRQLPHDGT